MKFKTNPYYKNKDIDLVKLLKETQFFIDLYCNDIDSFKGKYTLLGVGNETKSQVYRLENSDFCVKISEFSKHVGRNQERQFQLNNQCLLALNNKTVEIEGEKYSLSTSPTIAVSEDESFAYTLMFELKNTIRLWDEVNIPFADKDSWGVIREIKSILKEYAKSEGFDEEKFLADMDVSGNNLMVDPENKVIYLIDPYVLAELKRFNAANTFAYGHVKRLVKAEEIALFEINPSIEMHILRHFKETSEDYKKSLIAKNYQYFDHSEKKFKEGVVTQESIKNALTAKGSKFNEYIIGIENPRKLLDWLKSKLLKLFYANELYTIEKGLESKIYLHFDYPEIVGNIDVVEFNDLSDEEKNRIRKVNRSKGHDQATKVNIIEVREKIPTKSIAFLLHKVPELDFFFGTAFPGYLNPDFADEESDKKYWENLVFIQ